MDVQPIRSRRSHIIGAVGLIVLVLLVAGIFFARQRQLAAQMSAPAGVCTPSGSVTAVDVIPPLPPGESPEAGISAYIQHLWQIGHVHVFLPAQLGW